MSRRVPFSTGRKSYFSRVQNSQDGEIPRDPRYGLVE